MDTKRIQKYFTQHLSTYPVIISAACIGIGVLMVVILANTRGLSTWLFSSLGLALLAIGAIIFVARAAIKIPDSEVDEKTRGLLGVFEADFKNKFDNHDIHKIRYEMSHGITSPKFEPIYFSTYCFESVDVPHKKGNDGKSRSAVYALSGLFFKPETICLGSRRHSLLEENVPSADLFCEVAYSSLGSAELVQVTSGGYEGATPYKHLNITNADGTLLASLPVLADAAADEYTETLNARILRAKEKLAAESGESNN